MRVFVMFYCRVTVRSPSAFVLVRSEHQPQSSQEKILSADRKSQVRIAVFLVARDLFQHALQQTAFVFVVWPAFTNN